MATEKSMTAWIKREQVELWNDLDDAIRHANNGVWSMRCESVCIRIIQAARLVGPTPNGRMVWRLAAGGVYETLLRIADVEPDMPSEEEWPYLDQMMGPHGGTRASATLSLAATVEALREQAEWLLDNASDTE